MTTTASTPTISQRTYSTPQEAIDVFADQGMWSEMASTLNGHEFAAFTVAMQSLGVPEDSIIAAWDIWADSDPDAFRVERGNVVIYGYGDPEAPEHIHLEVSRHPLA